MIGAKFPVVYEKFRGLHSKFLQELIRGVCEK
jgi:hypothetical protein